MKIVSREEWGARPARSRTRLHPDRVERVVLHHTTGSYAGHKTVRAIQKYHQDTRNWADVGYNFLVSPDGVIFEGRGWDYSGAHARGQNSTSIGVAYIGDGGRPIPDEAKRSIVWLRNEATQRFPVREYVGHRDVGATACPGAALYRWWTNYTPSGDVAPEPVEAPPVVPTPVPEPRPVQRISERLSPVPDLRAGWRATMRRRGWLGRG